MSSHHACSAAQPVLAAGIWAVSLNSVYKAVCCTALLTRLLSSCRSQLAQLRWQHELGCRSQQALGQVKDLVQELRRTGASLC